MRNDVFYGMALQKKEENVKIVRMLYLSAQKIISFWAGLHH